MTELDLVRLPNHDSDSYQLVGSAESVNSLEELLCQRKQLKVLDLSGFNLEQSGVQRLMRPFTLSPAVLHPESSLFALKVLYLSRNNIGDAGVLVICRSLLQFSRRIVSQNISFCLEELYLDDNLLTDKAAFCLAQLLNSKPHSNPGKSASKSTNSYFLALKVLSIGYNKNITSDGIVALLGDTTVGSISPLVKLLAPSCSAAVTIFHDIAVRISTGLAPKLEYIDLAFSESDANKVIQLSGANYSKIFSSPASESLGRSLKVLSDTLVMTTNPGPTRNGPRYSPSKSKTVLYQLCLGDLPICMFNTCVQALNQGLLHISQRQLYEDCLMGLESINPAAKFFGINYVTNIAAWVEEGIYNNLKFVQSPPSVGDRFTTARSIDAERSHIKRIRDSSPQASRNNSIIEHQESLSKASSPITLPSPRMKLQENGASNKNLSPGKLSGFVAKEGKESPLPSFATKVQNMSPKKSASIPESPSSPTFKHALSMSENLKSAIKDLTNRVKASQLSLESTVSKNIPTARLEAALDVAEVSLPVSPPTIDNKSNINLEQPNAATSNIKKTNPNESSSMGVTVETIKSIVEESLQRFLATSSAPQQPSQQLTGLASKVLVQNSDENKEGQHSPLSIQLSSPVVGVNVAQSPIGTQVPSASNASTSSKPNQDLLLMERDQLLQYLQQTRKDLREVAYQQPSQQPHFSQVDNSMENRLKSVEHLLYHQLREETKQQNNMVNCSALTIQTGPRNDVHRNGDVISGNPLSRRLVSSLVKQQFMSMKQDDEHMEYSTMIRNQRESEKRLLYFDDIEQRLDLIEHLLRFDQQLQDEQDELTKRVAMQDRTQQAVRAAGLLTSNDSNSFGVNETSNDSSKRKQRREWIQHIQQQSQNQVVPYQENIAYAPYQSNAHNYNYTTSGAPQQFDEFADILDQSSYGYQSMPSPSYLAPASRQYLANSISKRGWIREEEAESVYSVPRHHEPVNGKHLRANSSAYAPPLPVIGNKDQYASLSHSALPLPPLPFTTPGFLSEPSIDTMSRWRQITPNRSQARSVSLSRSDSEAFTTPLPSQRSQHPSTEASLIRSNRKQEKEGKPHHYMQHTSSSTLRNNAHNFHSQYGHSQYAWTPNGIATSDHFDNPSPSILRRHW